MSGVLTGAFGFHTGLDDPPAWWRVQLGAPSRLYELRLYNRVDNATCAARFSLFAIDVAVNAQAPFQTVFKRDGLLAPEMDNPIKITFDEPPVAAIVRIRLLEPQLLHLDEVEVFGTPP